MVSQALKESKFNFKPQTNMHELLSNQSRSVQNMNLQVILGTFNKDAKYLRYREENIK